MSFNKLIICLTIIVLFLLVSNTVDGQIWSWGYSLDFDKQEYLVGSQGTVTLSFDVFPNAEVSNITITLYFIKPNEELTMTTLEHIGSTGVFAFYFEKKIDFVIPQDVISGPINYIAEFAIRGPYDPNYTHEATSVKQGLCKGYTVKIVNPSLLRYDDLLNNYNDLNSSYATLEEEKSLLNQKIKGIANEKNFYLMTTAILGITIIVLGSIIVWKKKKVFIE